MYFYSIDNSDYRIPPKINSVNRGIEIYLSVQVIIQCKDRDIVMYPLVIEYTEHARKRLYERGISESDILETIDYPDEVLLDTWTNRLVAVSLDLGISVVYIQKHDRIVIVTVMRLRELNHVLRSHRKRFRKISVQKDYGF